ncbi:MAG: hypothetical protein ACRDKU_02835 [Gaiellaceae bacterium]
MLPMTRWGGIAGLAYLALYLAAFAMGIEVGHSEEEIREHYADSGARSKEVVAFFLISAAALAFVLFASVLRALIARVEQAPRTLTALAWAGGVGYAILVLSGNAVSRASAFTAMDEDVAFDVGTRQGLEDAGLLLFASGTIMAGLLVVGASLAALRFGVLPRWLAWTGFPAAALLPLAVGFVGFLVLWLWVLVVSITLLARRT